jgi:aspartate/methionine/tyrosine aminotransferase
MDAPIPKVKDLARGKRDVVSFAQGLPWFGPPPAALARTLERLGNGEGDTYGDVPGRAFLRELLAADLKKRGLVGIGPANICLTPGANQAVVIALSVLADPGDDVILFRPYYFNNLMALQMLGLNPVFVDTGPEGLIDPSDVRKKIGRRTRAMIVISPNNPTGAVIDETTQNELIALSREHGFAYLSDEAYRDFAWDGPHRSASTGGSDNVVGIFSFSKSFGMAGWRLGFMTGPEELIAGAIKASDTLHICPPIPAQLLAEEVLVSEPDYPRKFRPDMCASRDLLISALRPLREQRLIGELRSAGGFYLYLRLIPAVLQSGWDITRRLIDEFSLAVVPGEAFGTEDGPCVRLSYGNIQAADMPQTAARLAEALSRVLAG